METALPNVTIQPLESLLPDHPLKLTAANGTDVPFDGWIEVLEAVIALKDKKPCTVGEVWTPLGFLSYYRSFIQDFSRLARPLFELFQSPAEMSDATQSQKNKGKSRAKKGEKGQLPSRTPITWTTEHQNVVSTLVEMLTNLLS